MRAASAPMPAPSAPRIAPSLLSADFARLAHEIARVEAPQWVMNDPEMLDRVHSGVYDQCRRSGQYPPYPPALIEAHEQAVISTGDRRMVEEMVEKALAARMTRELAF